ncbi:tgf beta receptor associated protein [Grosmannia clavigera kw1407]|uniref:Tgf beta receptor associated protein n=1 Tax=Grosmannia clavigera (strain kw1407 / UAMH 11150) TaxID=655863 RepID=F0XLS8_GROCL|nr:tgf beta receptor associated protein [Grosmannia clavigera kw1407]EFX01044.1 tgf beta receptor associated protein [Grosmannia clavigera kw1407]
MAESDDGLSLEPGPFVLRSLLDNIPLSADGTDEDIKINCVEYYDGNLYVGTSASELLHFVQIPPDPNDEKSTSVFILASRLKPPFSESANSPSSPRPGVQQIVLLPPVGKACVRCNWTVTFYSLPELTPIFREVKNCNWIGGVDLTEEAATSHSPRVTILLSLNRRLQVVRIGDEARAIKNIDLASSIRSARHDAIACVADTKSYTLVHVEQQAKIPLTNISSSDQTPPPEPASRILAGEAGDGLARSSSNAQPQRRPSSAASPDSHNRSTSLGGTVTGSAPQQQAPKESDANTGTHDVAKPAATSTRSSEETGSDEAGRIRHTAHIPPTAQGTALLRPKPGPLEPLIAAPTPEEFLIVTGTSPVDPGIGMFVNLDGDPTRPTLEFARYPSMIVVDGGSADPSSLRMSLGGAGGSGEDEGDGYILAAMSRDFPDGLHHGLEIQRWDVNNGEDEPPRSWLEVPGNGPALPVGIHPLVSSQESLVREVVVKLCQKRVSLPCQPKDGPNSPKVSSKPVAVEDEEASRYKSEVVFASRLAKTSGRIAVWSGNQIWWAMRNPLVLQLEAALAADRLGDKIAPSTAKERVQLFTVLGSFRGREAKTELEFVTFSYIRQRAGGLLFMGLLQSDGSAPFSDGELKAMGEVLLDSGLDPRIIVAMIPGLREEIVQSRKGIWIFGGVKDIVERYLNSDEAGRVGKSVGSLQSPILHFLRRFLIAWRRKKGFGSVADEGDVFRSVDAALLAVLLELDQGSPKGLVTAKTGSVRGDLNDLVDKGVDCFGRAVELLEAKHRLFVLSRLYQSRKQAADVLATWRRIAEGERDDGGELQDGEQRIREYLAKVSSQTLVQEYGLWLAKRRPKLGVQVFADDKARAPRFEPTQVVPLLRNEAPGAVKYYLEHLVFAKGQATYVDELIAYYLEVVTGELRGSEEARSTMRAVYEAYRALQPPKPTFHRFLRDNTLPDDEVAQSRLRLLELLGSPYPFDVGAIRRRLAESLPAATATTAAAEQLLVPEAIILDGREHRHEDALRLLVHGLGDYDTAVSYCERGGSSLYVSVRGADTAELPMLPPTPRRRESLPPTREEQAGLFRALLVEFMAIEDVSDRVEQTGALLGRFAGYFDVLDVLQLLPDSWAVDVAAGFLVHALRELVRDRNESSVARALSGAENLRLHAELIAQIDKKGPQTEELSLEGSHIEAET